MIKNARQKLTVEPPRIGKILHALGNLSWSQCRFDESLDYHSRTFAQYMKTLGASHHRTADCDIGSLCTMCGLTVCLKQNK